jgi:hypothetical protein
MTFFPIPQTFEFQLKVSRRDFLSFRNMNGWSSSSLSTAITNNGNPNITISSVTTSGGEFAPLDTLRRISPQPRSSASGGEDVLDRESLGRSDFSKRTKIGHSAKSAKRKKTNPPSR